MNVTPIIKAFGNTDLYLIDAILKDHFSNMKSVLDAGCGEGRNLPYFLSANFDVTGIDQNTSAVRMCRLMAKSFQQNEELYKFDEGDIRELPYKTGKFDLVISSAVLHFAKDTDDFRHMFSELVRVLAPNGILFVRMSSNHCQLEKYSENNFTFLLPVEDIDKLLTEFSLEKVEPVKSVIVEDKRVMTTLILRKR